ncbi:hypothetical protein [Amycolatopsis sp. cmx-4-54]|uniref:hypothetical protein n=1 Tax=Amycolatopsis sp. cmx-4-54 TaxID=2790936 RepID=UPI00397AB9FF
MTRQMSTAMRDCIDLCNECHVRCEKMMTRCMEMGGAKLGMMMVTCADMSRMSADMMMRCSAMIADLEMMRMCAKMCGLASQMMRMCAQECAKTGDAELADAADMMTRCAELCGTITAEMMMENA